TTVALNLAASFVLTGRKILLIDADFRKPEINNRLGLPDSPGLSDAVKHDLSIDKVIHKMEDSRFTVVTSGSDTVDPVVFFSSLKFRRELAQFDMESDLAILDSPPLLVSDALIMASKVDAVLVVLQPGRVSELAATQMMDQLRRSKAKVLGVVLNQVPSSRKLRYFDKREVNIPLEVDDEVASPEEDSKPKAKKPKKKIVPFKKDENNTKS
ncbi:MAG: CpsD/CapB family tyrosine-protein kinase, partial [Anaerolineales bacterium]|nr:CpsD/CapB family tyrosine-protein kinase [Anaerolineales bacterium]